MDDRMFGRKGPRLRNTSELCCAFTSELRRILVNPLLTKEMQKMQLR